MMLNYFLLMAVSICPLMPSSIFKSLEIATCPISRTRHKSTQTVNALLLPFNKMIICFYKEKLKYLVSKLYKYCVRYALKEALNRQYLICISESEQVFEERTSKVRYHIDQNWSRYTNI